MQKKWQIFAAVSLFWIGIFLMAKFPPSESELLLRYAGWSKYAAVTVPENFIRELPFPIPTAILSLISWTIPTEIFWFRLPNLVFGLGWLAAMTALAPAGFGVIAAGSLGVVWTIMSDFPTVVTLLLATIILTFELKYTNEKKKLVWLGFLSLWLGMTCF